MKSTARLAGHPIHPMVIPYPFALLTSAVAFEVGARITGRQRWADTASQLTGAGLGTALVAAVPGIVDYFGTIPRGTRARRTATLHALSNVGALVCFFLGERQRRQSLLPPPGLALAVLGTGLLSIGGWLGGDLVYHERVGVDDGSRERNFRIAGQPDRRVLPTRRLQPRTV